MARVSGVNIPDNKRGVIALTYVYGIGRTTAQQVLETAGVDVDKKVQDWTEEEANSIRAVITEQHKTEGVLRSELQLSIKCLLDIACYRGLRHRRGLPVRGQHTKNNARTRKGKRKTVANKKIATR